MRFLEAGDLELIVNDDVLPFQKRDAEGNTTGDWVHALRVGRKVFVSSALMAELMASCRDQS